MPRPGRALAGSIPTNVPSVIVLRLRRWKRSRRQRGQVIDRARFEEMPDGRAGSPRRQVGAVDDLYRRFVELIAACGPYEVSVTKTAITFKGNRRGFAGAKPRPASLDGYLDLQRQVEDARILSSSTYTSRLFVHRFRVTHLAQLDGEFAGWIREADAVGSGEHLDKRDRGGGRECEASRL